MLIWWALMGPLLGASCGYMKTFRGPRSGSRSLQIRPKSVRPSVHPYVTFFFEPISKQENGILLKKREKRRPKKWYCVDNDVVIEVTQNEYISGLVQVGYISDTHRVHRVSWIYSKYWEVTNLTLATTFFLVPLHLGFSVYGIAHHLREDYQGFT